MRSKASRRHVRAFVPFGARKAVVYRDQGLWEWDVGTPSLHYELTDTKLSSKGQEYASAVVWLPLRRRVARQAGGGGGGR